MGLFSRKKKEEEDSGKEGDIPKTLPDTIMQRMSSMKGSQEKIESKGLYTDDIKKSLLSRNYQKNGDDHKRLPEDIYNQSKDKDPSRHEMEKVLMIRDRDINRDAAGRWSTQGLDESDYGVDESRYQEREIHKPRRSIMPDDRVKRQPRYQDEQEEEYSKRSEMHRESHHEHHWPSFFTELERRIIGKKHPLKHVLSQDLMSRMKEYHDSVSSGDSFFMHEFEIEEEIANSLSALKDIEADWLFAKRQAAAAGKTLFEREQEMERKLASFKGLLVSAEKFKAFNMAASDEQAFFLRDGKKLYSVQHLVNELPGMSDEMFSFHVNDERNDFASWIEGVFRLNELASRMREIKTKQELLDLLKN